MNHELYNAIKELNWLLFWKDELNDPKLILDVNWKDKSAREKMIASVYEKQSLEKWNPARTHSR